MGLVADVRVARIESLVKEAGGVYLSSPVFGQPPAAKAKQLVTVIAGDEQGREYVKPLLAAIGKKTIDCGDDVKKGESIDPT
jgi:3-hydroxyisobutyrate dehydrogenase